MTDFIFLVPTYFAGIFISAYYVDKLWHIWIWPLVLLKSILFWVLDFIKAVLSLDINYRILGLSIRKLVLSLSIIAGALVIPYYIGQLLSIFIRLEANSPAARIVLMWFVGWFFPSIGVIMAVFIIAAIREYILWLKK